MQYLISILVIMASLSPAFSQQEVYSKSEAAIQGYDPVAYFRDQKPVKGGKQFTYAWKGATWKFSSARNMNDFKSNPEAFAPQYGGYCAYGVAEGHKAPTSPDAWTIVDGKLYLNYDKGVKALWNKDQNRFIKMANENWETVKKEKD